MRELTYLAVVLRPLTALFMGGILGLERGLKNRPAGLRTYMLVCVGSCLIMMTNQYIFQTTGTGDPTRMSAQVISGIGFLGAGTIVVTQHNQIKGLTTAAGLWACAAAGLALGIGFYEAAAVGGISIFTILTLLQRWDDRMHMKGRVFDMYFELAEGYPLGELIRAIRSMELEIFDIRMETDSVLSEGYSAFIATVKAKRRKEHKVILKEIGKLEGVMYLEEI
ncbi:MAG: MgtC/SapB family protein [Oscillospiraceae bacterium]|nr:MgtC/SapB family protein [Oscillospiraceae bacterium]